MGLVPCKRCGKLPEYDAERNVYFCKECLEAEQKLKVAFHLKEAEDLWNDKNQKEEKTNVKHT